MLSLVAFAVALLPLLAVAVPMSQRDGTSQYIQSGANPSLCLAVATGDLGDGTVVTSVGCFSASLWDINRGDGLVQLHGTNYCLDAGTGPHNNVPMKVWTCYPGLTQQQWYYTDDNRIAITGGTQCLDEGFNGPQTYQCTTGDTNQIWYASSTLPTSTISLPASTGSATPSQSFSTSATITISASPSPSPSPSAAAGINIHPNGDTTKCLTVGNGYAAIGTVVNIASCFGPNGTWSGLQSWNIQRGSGAVQLAGTNYCLDAASNPANGVGAKIWTCYPGLSQQTWYYTDDNRIAITGGTQCLDVTAGSQPINSNPYGSLEDVQTWQCTTGDVQQIWTT